MRDAARPKLLVSIHDVSPVTLAETRDAIDLVGRAGVPPSALTVLAVPFHAEQISLADDDATTRYLRELVAAGATLVSHGYTHRMVGRARTPWQWLLTRWFARDEAELALCDGDETARRLDAAAAIFAAAELEPYGFVPPAWLLSAAAAAVVVGRFPFVETFGGIAIGDGPQTARRLVGWGSLTAIEALATSAFAWLQSRRRSADTRLAIHPPDLRRRRTRRSLERTLARMVPKLEPMSYRTYIAERGAA